MFWKREFLVLVVFLVLGLIFVGCTKYKTYTKEETIFYETEYRENPDKFENEENTIQPGKEGTKEITYRQKYDGDTPIGKPEKVDEKVLEEPQNEIIEKGVKKNVTEYVFKRTLTSSFGPSTDLEISVSDVRRVTRKRPSMGVDDVLEITFHIKNANPPSSYLKDIVSFGHYVFDDLVVCKIMVSDKEIWSEGNASFNKWEVKNGEEDDWTLSYILNPERTDSNPHDYKPDDIIIVFEKSSIEFEKIPLSKFWQGPFNE